MAFEVPLSLLERVFSLHSTSQQNTNTIPSPHSSDLKYSSRVVVVQLRLSISHGFPP